jgi:hypothetical protein
VDRVSKNLVRGHPVASVGWLYALALKKKSVCYKAGGKRWMVSPAAWVVNWPVIRYINTPIYETERMVSEREIIKKINGIKGNEQREQGEPVLPAVFDESDTDN